MNNQNNGLGVALTKCYFCGEDDRIVFNTKLSQDHAARVEQMNGHVIDMTPCGKCRDLMNQGVILITIDDEKSDRGWNKQSIPNPYRTGGFFVVKDDAVRHFAGTLADWAIKHRWMFIEHKAAEMVGLFELAEK